MKWQWIYIVGASLTLTTVYADNEINIMKGFPPPPNERVTITNWDTAPYNIWSFQHMSNIFPTAPVSKGDRYAYIFPVKIRDIDNVSFTDANGSTTTIKNMLANSHTDGFLVLHKGKIVNEQYFNGMNENTLHLSHGIAQSLAGTLIGKLSIDGKINLNVPVQQYIPELSNTGYANATLQQVSNMTSGVKYSQNYNDPNSEVVKHEHAVGWKPPLVGTPNSNYEFIRTLTAADSTHGKDFKYRDSETDVLAWCMERSTNQYYPELISQYIWSKIGAEHDASFTLDSAGTAVANGGFNATLRDYGRFAQMIANQGLFNGSQVVPQEWVKSCRLGNIARFGEQYKKIIPTNGAFSNHWWVVDNIKGVIASTGLYGQVMYINPKENLVIIKLSSWPEKENEKMSKDFFTAVKAIEEYLGKFRV